jgi:hypothetical protein
MCFIRALVSLCQVEIQRFKYWQLWKSGSWSNRTVFMWLPCAGMRFSCDSHVSACGFHATPMCRNAFHLRHTWILLICYYTVIFKYFDQIIFTVQGKSRHGSRFPASSCRRRHCIPINWTKGASRSNYQIGAMNIEKLYSGPIRAEKFLCFQIICVPQVRLRRINIIDGSTLPAQRKSWHRIHRSIIFKQSKITNNGLILNDCLPFLGHLVHEQELPNPNVIKSQIKPCRTFFWPNS